MLKAPSRARPGWERLPEHLWRAGEATWLVIRPAWRPLDGYDTLVNLWKERARQTGRLLKVQNLGVRDIGWGNRPLLRYHYFQSPGPVRPGSSIVLIGLRRPEGAEGRNVPVQ